MNFIKGYHLDKARYYHMEHGKLVDIEVTNDSDDTVQIQEVGISFDWDWQSYWYETCNLQIKPKTRLKLPIVHFNLDHLDISEGSHHFKPFIKYRIFKNGKWDEMTFESKKGEFFEIVQIPDLGYKVFISHSNDETDLPLLEKFANALNGCGVEGYFAESDVIPGSRLWDKIEREIRKSDAFLILWTAAASQSQDVREEIGIAIGAKKKVLIPIVEKKVPVTGSLKAREVEWIPLDHSDPNKGLETALSFIVKKGLEKQSKQSLSKSKQ